MKQKSKWLFALLLLLIVFVSIRTFLYADLYYKVENDAKAINELGVIRGSIQRFVKLELGELNENDLSSNIDSLLDYYIEHHIDEVNLLELKACWEQLKNLIGEYRVNPSKEKEHLAISLSDKCWELADNIVSKNQNESEKNISTIRLLTISFVLDFFIIIIFTFISKKYVRDNLEVSVLFDPLTKAYNRRYFTEVINHEIEKVRRSKGRFSLIMLDIDHFKSVNDIYGHTVGDHVLKEMVQVIKKNIRKYDIVSRIGGEEFTILLPNTEIEYAYGLAERIRKSIEEYKFIDDYNITVSLGITHYENGDTLDTILKRSDDALYTSKNSGRNRTSISSNTSSNFSS